jgi:hypothetical protein
VESSLLFRLYLAGAIVGSVAQVAMALFIIYIRRKAIGLSQRSTEENINKLCREVRRSAESQREQDGYSIPLQDLV